MLLGHCFALLLVLHKGPGLVFQAALEQGHVGHMVLEKLQSCQVPSMESSSGQPLSAL